MSGEYADLIETLSALGVDPRTKLDETMSATAPTLGANFHLGTDLPDMVAEPNDSASDQVELQLGHELGRGAMGVITTAWQRSLRRWVAVKQPRSCTQAASIVHEARLAGGLDHPHIVPVHTLALIQDEPAMVMKQVEGATWRTLLRRPDHPMWKDWPGDQLERHLEILTQVCRALEFAHDRGVLHLDVKVENVMVGHFGEVWLMDWGVAARVEQLDLLPHHEVVGTLAYFAPEQLYGRRNCGEQTDVFLLGAALEEILTGQPRYSAHTLAEAVDRISACEPAVFPPQTPTPLVDVARRACRKSPLERYGSVREFREALREAVSRLDAARLLRAANDQLAMMKSLITQDDSARDEEVAGLAATTRFSLEQAEEQWPHTARGVEVLQELNVTQARWEMRRGNLASARALLGQLTTPIPQLISELEDLEGDQVQALKELHEFKRERTFTSGGDYRRAIAVGLNGLFWLVTMTAWGYLGRDDPWWLAPRTQAIFSLALVVLNLVVVQLQLPLFTDTHVRRGFLSTYLMFMVGLTLNRVLAIMDGTTYQAVFYRDGLIMALFLGALGAFVHPKAWWAAGLALLGVFAGAALPDYPFEVAGATLCAVNFWIASLVTPGSDLEL